jgi:putative ABC transport system substrate-binding protein
MKRRAFLTLLGGAAASPLPARGQQPDRIRRIGVLTGSSPNDGQSQKRIEALKQRLDELGWREGRNLRIDRWAGEIELGDAQAAALVASAPDVIVVTGNPGVAALRRQTHAIPIVFAQVGDPVGSGFVSSLARPGGNVTGFMHYEPAMGGKWLEALKDIAPGVSRALILLLPEVKANVENVREAQTTGPVLQVAVTAAGIHNAGDIEREVTAFARVPNGGLIVLPNPIGGKNSKLIAALAISHRLPAIAAFRYQVENGLLASYGIIVPDLYRRTAEYVDRILRGAKPADLPVQAPVKFELVINLKTAKALGLDIPARVLARADEVIE